MNIKNKKGFFLTETIVIIAIVAAVLLGTFKLFSSVYSKYKEGESYNTVNATNAVVVLKSFYQSIGMDPVALLNGGYYIELTNNEDYFGEYYDKLKDKLGLDNSYLIDLTKVYDGTNINVFDVSLRKYLKTIRNSGNTIVLLVVINDTEYSNISVVSNSVTLVGDSTDEFAVYIPINGTFTDPGYLNWEGAAPTTSWDQELDTTKAGRYYLTYSFDGYLIKRKVVVGEYTYNFDYTGAAQIFTAPLTGYYQLEVWGAQGGQANATYTGGYGGYSRGVVSLTKDQQIYVYVGGQGNSGCGVTSCAGGYNGGGSGYLSADASNFQSGGGGATHISLASGLLSSQTAGNILIVAGGGGGGYYHTNGVNYSMRGANGGGFNGVNGVVCVYGVAAAGGGTQSAGGAAGYRGTAGSFGTGGSGTLASGTSSGGGAGYYGGGAAAHSGTGGGSSYIANASLLTYGGITKAMYCYSCTTSATASTLTYSTTNVSSAPTSTYSKMGNGYATISYIGE